MADHIGDDLPLLLTGEADRTTVDHAAAHLRTCEDCLHDLVAVVVAHASIESAHRFAPEIVTAERVASTPTATPTSISSPDLSRLFAEIRSEDAQERQTPQTQTPKTSARRGRLRTRPYLVAAAVAAMLIGGGAYVVAHQGNGGTTPNAEHITLDAYGVGTTPASASVTPSTGNMRVDAATLPQVPGMHYEVWLTNAERTRLQPIGWVGADGQANITVPTEFMQQYTDIEVSVQQVNAPSYDYSGRSVLRGSITE